MSTSLSPAMQKQLIQKAKANHRTVQEEILAALTHWVKNDSSNSATGTIEEHLDINWALFQELSKTSKTHHS